MNKYRVKIRISKAGAEYATATFEIFAKSKDAAAYRVVRLFSEETIDDGEGIDIISVEGG